MTSSLPLLSTTPEADWLVIGTIVAPQGLDGAVRVYPDSDFPQRFLDPGPRWLQLPHQATPQPVELLHGRFLAGSGLYVITLAESQTREQAEQLRNAKLLVAATDRPPLDPDEFHLLDLIGLEVMIPPDELVQGTVVGLVTAGNDLLEVTLHRNPDIKVLIPFVREIVPTIDLEARRIYLSPPLGLIPVE